MVIGKTVVRFLAWQATFLHHDIQNGIESGDFKNVTSSLWNRTLTYSFLPNPQKKSLVNTRTNTRTQRDPLTLLRVSIYWIIDKQATVRSPFKIFAYWMHPWMPPYLLKHKAIIWIKQFLITVHIMGVNRYL